MSESTIRKLVEARLRVVNEVNSGKLSVTFGADLLGITRQGLWKLRRSVKKYWSSAVTGRKRGPKGYKRPTRGIILISAVDDCSRFGMANCYYHNNSQNAASFLIKMVREALFPIRAVGQIMAVNSRNLSLNSVGI